MPESLNKVWGPQLYWERDSAHMFFWGFCDIFKNIYDIENVILVIASENPCTCQIRKNCLGKAGFFICSLRNTSWKVSLFGDFLVRIFPDSDCIRKDTEYFSIFSPNMRKYRWKDSRYGSFSCSENQFVILEIF